MNIREAKTEDFEQIWPLFREIARAGETYAFPVTISRADAEFVWLKTPHKTYVYVEAGKVLGTYYLKPNQGGPGDHVCNCGYMVAKEARGKGIATQMCEHSQRIALELGYKAMQFNFVASTNEGAIKLWENLGFEIVGRLSKAFDHPEHGFVDALVMYKWLDSVQ